MLALAVAAVLAATCGDVASAQDVGVGSFGELFSVAGSLNYPGGPPLRDRGAATRGWLTDVSSAPAVLADGSLLIALRGEPGVVERLGHDGRLTIAAGHRDPDCFGPECTPGPPGDGGPAVQARLRDATAVAAMPDGGYLILDALAGVVRRVDSGGIITTVAGNGEHADPGPVGVGGPAVKASLAYPEAIAASPDGSFYIADGGRILHVAKDGTLRLVADLPRVSVNQIAVGPGGELLVADSRGIERVAPDGRVSRLARLRVAIGGLVALRDGGALTIDMRAPRLVRVSPSGRVSVVLASRAFRDFAGREPNGDETVAEPLPLLNGLALSSEGLFVATTTAILLAPTNPSSRLMVRIRDARTSRGRVRLKVQGTLAAAATLRLHPFDWMESWPELARATATVSAGTHWLELPRQRARHGLFTIQVELAQAGAVASDSVSLLLGPALPSRVVRDAMEEETTDDGLVLERYRCRRMSARRIDCWARSVGSRRCSWMTAFVGGADGVVRQRNYACSRGRPRFRRRPHWQGHSFVVVPQP